MVVSKAFVINSKLVTDLSAGDKHVPVVSFSIFQFPLV